MDVLNSMWPEDELWKGSDSRLLDLVANELSPQQVVPSTSPERATEDCLFAPQILGDQLLGDQALFQPLFLDPAIVEQLSPASSPPSSPTTSPSPPSTRSKRSAPAVDTKPTKKITKQSSAAAGKPKRKRKRAKHVPSAIIISSVELKTMTCEQVDQMASEIEKERPLTAEEESDLKSYKRRIMNRESAKESRQKKQELIKDISDALEKSKEHSARLERRIQELERENAQLRLQQGGAPPMPQPLDTDEEMSDCLTPGSGSSSDQGSPTSPSSFWSLGKASLPGKAGVCLFVVLLSFGLMFTAIQPGDFNNHSQLSAIAPLILQQSQGRAITNDPFVSAAQLEKLSSLASAGSRAGSYLETGLHSVHSSRDLLDYEPVATAAGLFTPLTTRSTTKVQETEEHFDIHQTANSTAEGCDRLESYDMDVSADTASVNVVFSSAATGRTELELDLHFVDLPQEAFAGNHVPKAVPGQGASWHSNGHSVCL
mmetsp:Transcript_1896/g.6768  ORF Transcript_1896/g.6768 Transcript_1896/m.6768 type:complete len:486 (+) Transcript_1896:79-1536(+)|eukprot:CAMPEP_0114612178 /NCGR_PEP_ID=MMETSP0168-20121206/4490_1 /TAXON_ID=95228 ORGANISM="Vannella sp., Strain DIVA3 517/6/12" /NCGR_SAMPLE_ID=MMETSP0168 /ASSEMBLY_ACC=CAM_ASM_000044 /LENGTH=485 /DNA_ID=CAMNT_0001823159 /DNA_START=35 /DNA_END=1492 /DNA_ORIENTATION=+